MANGFRKSCNPTVRKFFEDFDLLPHEIKQMLFEQDRMPNQDDLKAAWELVEEDKTPGMAKIFQNLHCFEEERKADREKRREEQKEAKRREREDRWSKRLRRHNSRIEVMVRVDPRKRMDKHANLVRTVMTEQELERALTRREENQNVQHAQPYWVRKWVEPKEIKEKQLDFMENEPTDSMIKALHNG